LDSAGEFTVDLARSAKQMAALARAHPNRWAFFLTQAGVLAGARSIKLSSGPKVESVVLEFAQPFDDLLDPHAVSLTRPGEAPFLTLLRQGLQWSMACQGQISLLVQNPIRSYLLTSSPQGTQIAEVESAPFTRVALFRRDPLVPWWKRPFHQPRAAAELLVEGRYRLAYCPVPVKLDGLSLWSGQPDLLPNFRKPIMVAQFNLYKQGSGFLAAAQPAQVPAQRYLIEGQVRHRPSGSRPLPEVGWLEIVGTESAQMVSSSNLDDGLYLLADWVHGYTPTYLYLSDRLCRPGLPTLPCGSVLYYHGRSRDQIFFQKHGLLSNPITLPELQTDAWTVVLADDEVRMDPSGLTPIIDDALTRRVGEIQEAIRRTQIRLAGLSR